MKKSVRELLDGCTAAELDDILTNLSVDAPDDGAAERVAAKALEKAERHPKKRFGSRLLLVAALALMLAMALVGCYVADVVEYNRAAAFFDLNSLSTEGLDRGQIKRIYRDITTESFTYDRSAAVIANSAAAAVSGAAITISNSVNNNLTVLNDSAADIAFNPIPPKGVYYGYDDAAPEDAAFVNNVAKYVDGAKVWTARIDGFSFRRAIPMGDRVFCYGFGLSHQGGGSVLAAMLDDSTGAVLWTLRSGDTALTTVDAADVNADGRIAVAGLDESDIFSTAAEDAALPLTFCLLDPDSGAVLDSAATMLGGWHHLQRMVCLGDGYLTEMWTYAGAEGSYTELVRFGADGAQRNRYRYDTDDMTYHIEDMIAVGGRVFLSATARPVDSKLYENIEEDLDGDATYRFDRYSDQWRDRARAEYSAVLLVLDEKSGEPGQFWSVGGAFGGALGTDAEGNLMWQVKRIIACGYSPATNSFSLFGVTRQYDYTFDSTQNLLRQERTDRIYGFRDH